jgi:hypothetical protein
MAARRAAAVSHPARPAAPRPAAPAGALYATLPLVRSRGQLTTFPNLRGPVQNLSSRNLKVAHLQQIKALYPDAFTWQHVLVPSGRSGRQEEQLLLGITPFARLASQQLASLDGGEQARLEADEQQAQPTPSRRATRSSSAKGAAATPTKRGDGGSAAGTPVKRVGSAGTPGLLSPGRSGSGAIGCSASVSGTLQQQKEFVAALRGFVAGSKVCAHALSLASGWTQAAPACTHAAGPVGLTARNGAAAGTAGSAAGARWRHGPPTPLPPPCVGRW